MGVVNLGMTKWAGRLLDSETRHAMITRLFYKGPMTAKQMADEVGLSPTTVLRHIEMLVDGDVLKEVEVPEDEKAFKRERYYDVTFPIWSVDDQEKMRPIYEKIGGETAEVVKKHLSELKEAYEKTELCGKGWKFDDPDIYSKVMASATCTLTREVVEKHGLKPIPEEKANKWGMFGEEKENQEDEA